MCWAWKRIISSEFNQWKFVGNGKQISHHFSAGHKIDRLLLVSLLYLACDVSVGAFICTAARHAIFKIDFQSLDFPIFRLSHNHFLWYTRTWKILCAQRAFELEFCFRLSRRNRFIVLCHCLLAVLANESTHRLFDTEQFLCHTFCVYPNEI